MNVGTVKEIMNLRVKSFLLDAANVSGYSQPGDFDLDKQGVFSNGHTKVFIAFEIY